MSLLARVNPQFVNIPAGKIEMGSTQGGERPLFATGEMSAFEMMDASVTVAQWKEYVEWGQANNISHARFIYGPDGRINQTIFGPSEKALQEKTVSLKAGQFVGDIQQVVPTWEEYVARFDGISDGIVDGARHFLGGDSPETWNEPAVMIKWLGAAGFCAAIGCELPTEAQYEYANFAKRKGDVVFGMGSNTDEWCRNRSGITFGRNGNVITGYHEPNTIPNAYYHREGFRALRSRGSRG